MAQLVSFTVVGLDLVNFLCFLCAIYLCQDKATASQHNKADDVPYVAEGRERTQQRQQHNRANDVPYLTEGRERTQQR